MARPALHAVRSAARLIACSVVMLGLVIIPALLLAQVFGWFVTNDSFSGLMLGLICSLIFWLFFAVFHLTPEKLLLSVGDRRSFLAKVRLLLDEMGYETIAQTVDTLQTRPRFNSFLFGGGIRIVVDNSKATIVGPKVSTEVLRKRLRMFNQLYRVHDMLEGQRKSTSPEPLLKRVEISLRVKPEQLEELRQRVLVPLAQSGEVICDVNILVQSDTGVPESTIEKQIRSWAQQNEIACDIHKHLSTIHESTLHPESILQ
jgi:hypothetical protein